MASRDKEEPSGQGLLDELVPRGGAPRPPQRVEYPAELALTRDDQAA